MEGEGPFEGTSEEFIEKYGHREDGTFITAVDRATGVQTHAYLPPDGKYILFTGPLYKVSHQGNYDNGTTQIIVKKK